MHQQRARGFSGGGGGADTKLYETLGVRSSCFRVDSGNFCIGSSKTMKEMPAVVEKAADI